MNKGTITTSAIGALLLAVTAAGCGTSGTAGQEASGAPAPAGNPTGGAVGENTAIHDALPASIRDAGQMTVVMTGTSLPWWEATPGKTGEYTGAGAELMKAVADVMGVKVDFVAIPDISGAIASISSKRYAYAFAPYGDTVGGPKERPGVEFVDVVREVVPFLVKKGNPKGVSSLDQLCGITLAAQVNGSAYRLAQAQADKCKKEGKSLNVLGVTGSPNGVLAVRSGRADAFFSSGAGLYYAAKTSNGQLEVVGADHANGFEGLFQGAVLPKRSEMTQPLLKSFEVLFQDGTYEQIMKKYGLDREIMDKPAVNAYATWLSTHKG